MAQKPKAELRVVVVDDVLERGRRAVETTAHARRAHAAQKTSSVSDDGSSWLLMPNQNG